MAGVHVLRNILGNKVLEYSELENLVEDFMKAEGVKSFSKLSGWALNDFLIYRRDIFDTLQRKQKKMVKLRKKGNQQKLEHEERLNVAAANDLNQLSDASAEQHICNSEANAPKETLKLESRHSSTLLYSRIPEVERLQNDSYFDLLQHLVSNGENETTKFIESLSYYENEPVLFSLDVVSMWNTPQRVKAHLIIGVNSLLELIGEEKEVDARYFDRLFNFELFNSCPMFKTIIAKRASRSFFIIEIASSFGCGYPCITKGIYNATNVLVEADQLWIKKGTQNIVCKQSQLETGFVYKWFLGESFKKESKQKTNNKTVFTSTESNRNSECNISNIKEPDDSNSDSGIPSQTGDSFVFFKDKVKEFKYGHYVLLAGDVDCSVMHISAFGLLPWLCVYDFDIFSGSHGLHNAMEDLLGSKRHLKTCCWNDVPANITERGTRWCYMRGCREFSNTRTDTKDERIEDIKIWFKQVKRGVNAICEKLASFVEDYTVLTIVFLWPENEQLVPFMMKFLSHMTDSLSHSPNIVVCMNKTQPITKTGMHRYKTMCDEYNEFLSVCHFPFENLCFELKHFMADIPCGPLNNKLPMKTEKDVGIRDAEITENEAAWLGEDLDVLYIDNPYSQSVLTEEEVHTEVTNFYKGGTLPWYVWYNNKAEESVIERSVQKELESKLEKHMSDYKTSTVTLFHAPGSGGTTLAQKVLWSLHKMYPAVSLKLRTNSAVEELDRKMTFLYEKTDLPIVLLADAEEESKVRLLTRRLKYTVILYVKRHLYKRPPSNKIKPDCVYLTGNVTEKESKELELKFGEKFENDKWKIDRLKCMTKEVNDGQNHCMYEYGMTVYLHEFKAIVSYVAGYLDLNRNSLRDLNSAQLCLGYLALVHYYGQASVPCQFFSSMFCKSANNVITLEDFPQPVEEFVVYDRNEGKRNKVRICHYIIAKEILEQILSRHTSTDTKRDEMLGISACRNLSDFCVNFIEYAGEKRLIGSSCSDVKFILTKTFIFRDEKDMGDNAEQVRRKPVLSRVMIDIPAGKPLFMERFKVLKKLVDMFPEDPNFIAHLGRFNAFCRPDAEHDAEECFQKAVRLCDEQVAGKEEENIEDGLKLTLMHIYHMYGIVKQRYVAKFTGRSQKEKVVTFDEDDVFNERIEDIVQVADDASYFFTKSRDITPENHDVYTYAYTGEIQVRLQICDFVMRRFKTHGKNGIKEFMKSSASERAKIFVHSSIVVVENLILECYADVDLVLSERESLQKLVMWYNTVFKDQELSTVNFGFTDQISDRRFKISALKLQSGRREALNGIETIEDGTHINEIINLYEENFSDVRIHGFQPNYSKRDLEREFRDWVHAVRHEKIQKVYGLESVLNKILFWNEQVMSPVSSFYVFVVYSLLGFGTDSTPGKTECLIEAAQRRENLKKMNHLVIRPKYPREWLGNTGNGIKRLKVGMRNIGTCTEDRDSTSSLRDDLQVCKGTICHPNTNHVNGMIELDLGVNVTNIRVYYIPKVPKLEGNRFAGQRVEFNLAFTIQHGYEAYNVKLLKRHGCMSCSRKIEFTSGETILPCKCGQDVYKDALNEVK